MDDRASLSGLPLRRARIRRARWNPGGHTFELSLRYEHPDRGPTDALIRYRGVRSLEPPVPELAALVEDVTLAVRAIDVGAAESDPEHRIELEPRGAIRVRFASVDLSEIPAPGPDYGDGGFRFELLSC